MITPSQPIARTPIARWETDSIGLQIGRRVVILIFGGYDSNNNRVAERRFEVTDATTPSVSDFLAAVPTAPTLKRQCESFGATISAELAGTVS